MTPALPASPLRAPATGLASTARAPPRPNLWSLLRDSVGMDLTRIALPVAFNEPLSFLQRLAEDLEYHELLSLARAAGPGPRRAALVAAFFVSHYSSTARRPSKPFNPLLAETYDLVVPPGFRLVAEQVTHHPPVTAVHAEGDGWAYHTAHEIRNRFRGNSLEVWPEGLVNVRFDDGEHYVYEQAKTSVHNIIVGELWLDNVGTVTIREVSKGDIMATVHLKRTALLFGEAKKVGDFSGKVCRVGKGGKPEHKAILRLDGNWNTHARVGGEVVWKARQRPAKKDTAGHTMTAWAWALNTKLDPTVVGVDVPVTDSRLRPDQRALEEGRFKDAAKEKERLEDKQRRKRKDGLCETPRWFELVQQADTGREEWRYKGGYFECKRERRWPEDLPHIY